MKTSLTIAVLIAIHSFIAGSTLAGEVQSNPQKLRYQYVVETDLTVEKFSEVFCDRLSQKHSWSKISTVVSNDNVYTSVFNFKDDEQHPWQCEVQIKKMKPDFNKMSVEMVMGPLRDS
jgi:hypothetical protein